jgi:DNA modification methylase
MLMQGAQVNLAVTSPPYASQRKYDESSGFQPIHPDQYVAWFDAVQANIAEALAPDGSWCLNIKEHCEDGQRVLYVKDLTLAHVRQWGWRFVDEYVWTHGGTPKAAVNRFKNGWEPVFHFTRGYHKFRPDAVMHKTDKVPDWEGQHPSAESLQGEREWRKMDSGGDGDMYGEHRQGEQGHGATFVASDGMAYPSNVLSLGKNRDALGHAAAFPVKLPAFFIKAYSDEGDSVYDPFIGSGTTLIAAEQLDRTCYGIEISPRYCDVIVERWQNLTGQSATRTSD